MPILPTRGLVLLAMGLLIAGVAAFVLIAKRREAGPGGPLRKELSEDHRQTIIARERSNKFYVPFALVIFVVAAIVIGGSLTRGFVTIYLMMIPALLMSLWYRARRLAVERDHDDPDERLAARSALAGQSRRVVFWSAVGLLGAWASAWFAVALFGPAVPAWTRSAVDSAVALIFQSSLGIGVGVLMVHSGVLGPWRRCQPHCVYCRYEHRPDTPPVQCPECGRVLTPGDIAHWRRSPDRRFLALGAVLLLFSGVSYASKFNPGLRGAVLARTPTPVLLARVISDDFSMHTDDAWAELQRRMPLPPDARDSLADGVIALAITGDSLLRHQRKGIEAWLASAWPASGGFPGSLDRLLTHVERAFAAGVDTVELWEAVGVLYALPAIDAPPAERARMEALGRVIDGVTSVPEFHASLARTLLGQWRQAGVTAGALPDPAPGAPVPASPAR